MDTGLIGRLDPADAAAEPTRRSRAPAASAAARRSARATTRSTRVDGWRLGGVRAPSYWKLAVNGGEPLDIVLTPNVKVSARLYLRAAGWLGVRRAGRGT